MKHAIKILIFILSLNMVKAQNNLLQNGSFENHLVCPPFIPGGIFNGSIPNVSNPSLYTPDYFNSCDSSFQQFFTTPSNLKGHQYPKSGDAYIGIATWENQTEQKEYIQLQMNEPLKLDHHYLFSCYLSLAEVSDYANADFGVHFDSDSLYFSTFNSIPLTPQLVNQPSNFFADTSLWMEFSGIYLALGGEQFIIIGNFKNNNSNPPDTLKIQPTGTQGSGTYYYIDDVSLIDLDSTQAVNENEALAQVEVFPNPVKESINLSRIAVEDRNDVMVSVTDITGKLVLQTKLNSNAPIDVSQLNAGLYFIYLESRKGKQMAKFVKE